MKIFISHSQKDPVYELLRMAFEGAHIACWDPASMRTGSNLGDALRSAIDECAACVFLATKNSTNSNWCLAELGAFWGAKKPVIIYLAEEQVTEEDIPPQFEGNLWTRDIKKVTQAASLALSSDS